MLFYVWIGFGLLWWIAHTAAELNRSGNAGEGPWAERVDLRRVFVVGKRPEYSLLGWRLLVAARLLAAAAVAFLLVWFFSP